MTFARILECTKFNHDQHTSGDPIDANTTTDVLVVALRATSSDGHFALETPRRGPPRRCALQEGNCKAADCPEHGFMPKE